MGTYKISFNAGIDIVEIKVSGFMSEADAASYVTELAEVSLTARQHSGRLLILFDNRESSVFSVSARQMMIDGLNGRRSSLDRTAIIVENALSKIQIRRSIDRNKRIFSSRSDAMVWLKQERNLTDS